MFDLIRFIKRFTAIILLLGAVFAGYKMYGMASQYREGQQTYSQLQQAVNTPTPASAPTPGLTEDIPPPAENLPAESAEEEKESPVLPITIDFDMLMAKNSDTVGWVCIEGTNINYPVVQGEDNRHYVSTLFDGSVNQAGSIFMDYRNDPGLTDVHTIIYGHNMRDKSMFADILNYQDQLYYDEHPVGFYITPEKSYSFELVSAYVASLAEPAWQLEFVAEEEATQWLSDAMARSTFVSRAEPQPGDRIITLSTCTYEFEEARFVLVGLLKEL